MKKILFSILLFVFALNLSAQEKFQLLFPKVKLNTLDSLIQGNWYYQYSFDSKGAFNIYEFVPNQEYNVPELMDFYPSSKKTKKRIASNDVELAYFRNSSCLEELEYFQDYKGSSSYVKLRSNTTDSDGFLLKCQIDFWSGEVMVDSEVEPDISIISLTSGLMVIEKKSKDGKKTGYHVYARGDLEEFIFSN